jgi:flavin-dependent dehydrogenase
MGGLHNTMRRCTVDGAPVVTGIVALGDSVCTTNPTLGRGLSLALRSAAQLVDATAAHGEDAAALAAAVDGAAQEWVRPFYADQAASDAARLVAMRHEVFGAPTAAPPAKSDRVTFAELAAASRYDADVFRAYWHIFGMVRLPEEVYTDADVVSRTHAVLSDLPSSTPVAGPTRDELEHALAG